MDHAHLLVIDVQLAQCLDVVGRERNWYYKNCWHLTLGVAAYRYLRARAQPRPRTDRCTRLENSKKKKINRLKVSVRCSQYLTGNI